MRSDLELIGDYVRNQSEESFAALVSRHLNLVYSAAARQVRSSQLAEEVAQSVFSDLARKSRLLAPDTILSAWLYQVTRRTAIDVVRREARRQLREQFASEMNAINATASDWTNIEPLLDDAMQTLDDTDRTAVLLRYFENKSLREVGQALGASEDAAQKRVSRAVDRLREFFVRHGVAVGSSGIGVVISAHAVQGAPIGLANTISATAFGALKIGVSAGTSATSGFTAALAQIPRMKFIGGLAVAALIGVTTFILFRLSASMSPVAPSQNAQIIAPKSEPARPAVDTTQTGGAATEEKEPDPRGLLQAVTRARERIVSGSMEFQVSTENFWNARSVPWTNRVRLAAHFDGPKLRYEQLGREYSYTYSANDVEAQEIQKRADGMTREAAVQAGLLKPFESHHTAAYDGSVVMGYWENDGKPNGTTIDDPKKGTSTFLFDPRCLGLGTYVSVSGTLQNCLAFEEAKSIELIGKDEVGGIPAWHVRVLSKYDQSLDFWIDASRPERLLKSALGSNVALSIYDDAAIGDPLPTEVIIINERNGVRSSIQRFVRSHSRFNQSVDPSSFTLAGLGMAVGTSVSDVRIHRGLGYWTGTELSEGPREGKESEATLSPSLFDRLALLDFDPSTLEALDAAKWILLNTPDGPEVQKAANAILKEHTRNAKLADLCKELERVRHRCSKPLLEAFLKDNPSAEVRGAACFYLATLLKDEAKFGADKKASAEAEKLFERVITEFSQVRERGFKLEDLAKPELSELRRLTVGKPAPEILGADLDGHPMRLSDYRGKVVVLVFWWPGSYDLSDYSKLVERMNGKPFAFLGVYGDADLAKAKTDIENHKITWPSFWDKRDGPIAETWNVRSWPSVWVLDSRGVIRYRGVRGRELNEAVDTLLRE